MNDFLTPENKLGFELIKKGIDWGGVDPESGIMMVYVNGDTYIIDTLKQEYINYLRGYMEMNVIIRRIQETLHDFNVSPSIRQDESEGE